LEINKELGGKGMIIKKNGSVETNSLFPNSDWYNEGNYIIDETKEENKELIEKIKANAPYMELIIEDGQIVDVIPTERPTSEPIIPEPTLEEKIELLQKQLLETQQIIIDMEYQKLLENRGM